jgi:sterol desaturase/sphingolipid hydroxylase (fatty acid hydroxylase superfamily)
VTNDGICVKYEPATAKELWALPFSEYKTLCIINTDQLYQLTHYWYPCMSFFSPFHSIHHQGQMMAFLTNMNTSNSKIIVGIAATDFL